MIYLIEETNKKDLVRRIKSLISTLEEIDVEELSDKAADKIESLVVGMSEDLQIASKSK